MQSTASRFGFRGIDDVAGGLKDMFILDDVYVDASGPEILEPSLSDTGPCPGGAGQCLWTVDAWSCGIFATNLTTRITTLYSGGTCTGNAAEGRTRQNASFPRISAFGLDVDPAGGVLARVGTCDFRFSDHTLYTVPETGPVTRLAGVPGASGYNGDNIPATSATLNCTIGRVLGSRLYDRPNLRFYVTFADSLNNRVRAVDEAGIITTVGGNGQTGPPDHGDGGPATSARISQPTGVTLQNNALYVPQGLSVRKIDLATNVISTPVGKGQGPQTDGALAVNVTAGGVSSVAFDPLGRLWFTDPFNGRINAVDTNGIFYIAAGTTSGGTPSLFFNGDNRPAGETSIGEASDIVFLPIVTKADSTPSAQANDTGRVLIADPFDARVRAWDPVTDRVTTFAGSGRFPTSLLDIGDGGPATQAKLRSATSLAQLTDGRVVIADVQGCRLRVVDLAGMISTLAGTNSCTSNPNATGPGTTIALGQPRGLAVDAAGNLYWAEVTGHIVRRMATDGTVTRVGGTGVAGVVPDPDGGPALSTKLFQPFDVAVTPDGSRLYILEFGRHAIRYIDFTQTPPLMFTLAGDGTAGNGGDGGPASAARFNGPTGIELAQNALLVSDTENHVIRAITALDTATPQIGTIAGTGTPGASKRDGTTSGLQTRLFGPSATAVTADGIYFAESYGHRVSRLAPLTSPTGPPGAPGTPTASVNGNDVTFTWTAPTTGQPPFTYTLVGRLTAGGPVVGTLPVGGVTSVTFPIPDGSFVVSIQATNAQGTGPESAGVAFTVPAVPQAPGPPLNFGVTVAGDAAQFTWAPPSTGGSPGTYLFVAALSAGGPPIATFPIAANSSSAVGPAAPVTSFTVPNVPPGTYYVRLHAQNAGGTSAASNEVTVVVVGPAPPGAPVMQPPVITGSAVLLAWTPASTGGAPASFLVGASSTPGGPIIASVTVTTTTLTVPNVPAGTYYVRVVASNAVGSSAPSNEVAVVVP
jgi:hypothetical protein